MEGDYVKEDLSFKIQRNQKKESQKIRGKRKQKLFIRRKWLIHHVKVILILKEHVLSENIHSDIVVNMIMKQVYHQLFSANH